MNVFIQQLHSGSFYFPSFFSHSFLHIFYLFSSVTISNESPPSHSPPINILGQIPPNLSVGFDVACCLQVGVTETKDQCNTGTCWSFSSTSFLESEIIRLTGKQVDLSEMYTVRNTYPKKAENFVMRQGKAQFSEGGLAHDVLNSVKHYGLVPQEAFWHPLA